LGIPKTFYDGNPEDRQFVNDFWAWLKAQPQQAWLYYARNANWDEADRMFVEMVREPGCDRALASWLFWLSEPAYYVREGRAPHGDSLLGVILKREAEGGFPQSRLRYNRVEAAFYALATADALDKLEGPPPFHIPRELCASFDGRNPDLPKFDETTERDLAEMFEYLDGTFPRTDEKSYEGQRRGGNWWFEPALKLPSNPRVTDDMTDIQAIDAVFGEHRASLRRIEAERLRRNRKPGPKGMNPDLKQRVLGLTLLGISSLLLIVLLLNWLAR
jgi:pentatricopeptide repeat protein